MLARVIGGNTANEGSDERSDDAASQPNAEQCAAHRRGDLGSRISLSSASSRGGSGGRGAA